ncbi:hypothetical protein GGI35DRAFT_152103 [Trichoderma velutinum]
MLLVSLLVPFAKTNRRPKIRRLSACHINGIPPRYQAQKSLSSWATQIIIKHRPRTFRQESSLPEEPTVPDLARSMEKTQQ